MKKKYSFSADAKFYIAGHRGMVGSAIARKLVAAGYENIITRTHAELDLCDQAAVRDFFAAEKIDYVVLAAARVGGIHANNTYPAQFIYDNLMIETNVIHEAYRAGVRDLLFLGSSCIYPKHAPQPMNEEHLLTSPLEPTNEPYAIAKIAGIKMCESYNREYGTCYRSVMPTNLYGPGDNYDLANSHVLPALIRKCHLAKLAERGDIEAIRKDEALFGPIPDFVRKPLGLVVDSDPLVFAGERGGETRVEVWGTGKVLREFLHVDDMAKACLFVMDLPWSEYANVCRATSLSSDYNPPSFLNVGAGLEMTIAEAATLVKEVVGFTGDLVYNTTQPDGTPRKLLDSGRLNKLGWKAGYELRDGIKDAYDWYLAHGA